MNATFRLAAFVALVSFFVGKSQASAVIYDSNGFETPPFATGPLGGQNGWVDIQNGSTAQVTAPGAAPNNATQVVQVDRVGEEVRVAYPTHVMNVASSPNGSSISVEWSMSYEQSTGQQPFGPFFAVEVYDQIAGVPYLIAAAGVDATTSEVLYQAPVSGILSTIPDGPGVIGQTPGEWMHYKLELDFATQTYDLLLDGVIALDDIEFVDNGLVPGGLVNLHDIVISGLAANGDEESYYASGTGYFDNLRITQGVPDAGATLSLLGLACGAIAFARRRA